MERPDLDKIEEKRNEAASAATKPSRFPGMTYAEGVRDALEWVMGELEDDLET